MIISKKRKEEEAPPGKPVLMNPQRRGIFSYLSRCPCSYLTKIGTVLGMSSSTVSWHVRKLVNAGYLREKAEGKRKVYYPQGLIDSSDVGIFALLSSDWLREVYVHVLRNEGLFQKEIAEALNRSNQSVERAISRLEKLRLLTLVEDGKFKRCFPTDTLRKRRDENYQREKVFVKQLMRRLNADKLKPAIVRQSEKVLLIEIQGASKRETLDVGLDPFNTALYA